MRISIRLTTTLALTAVALASPAPSQAAGDSRDLCRAVAKGLAAYKAGGDRDPQWPVERLTQGPSPLVTVDQGDYPQFATPAEAEAYRVKFGARFRHDAELKQTFDDYFAYDNLVVRRMGMTDIRMLENDQGTMHCTNLMFYTERTGTARPAPNPPQYAEILAGEGEPRAFCNTDIPYLGVVAGTPAFIEQAWRSTDFDYDISISAWRDRRWSKPCHVKISYAHDYRLSDLDCGDLGKSACGELRKTALRLAPLHRARLAKTKTEKQTSFAWSPVAPADTARLATLTKLLGAPSAAAPPTTRKADEQIAWGLGYDRMSFPLRLGGRTRLAVIGRQTIGWREFPGFYMVVYDLEGGALKSVASVSIDGGQGAVTSLKQGS